MYNKKLSLIIFWGVISIVIDSDRGHCYEHFKKINQFTLKIEPVTCI